MKAFGTIYFGVEDNAKFGWWDIDFQKRLDTVTLADYTLGKAAPCGMCVGLEASR